MKKRIALIALVGLITSMMSIAHPGIAVHAQVISFPAEINKSFTPISIPSGGITRLNVTVYNPNSFALSNATWTDNLVGVQPGLFIANPANISNTCGGTVIAVPGTTTLSLSGGTVPAQVGTTPGECTVGINVTSTTLGNLINTIPANELSSTGGGVTITNATPASATVTVVGVASPTLTKAFDPNTIWVGETSVVTITITNTSAIITLTQTSITDTLPANVVIANPALPANSLQNCGGSASLAATPGTGSITLNNGAIPPNSSCIVRVNVTSSTSGVYTNTIPANAITTEQGVTNASPASAPLNVQDVGIEKAFSPPSFQAGDITTLTITLQNPSSSAFTGVNISDTLPGTVLTVVAGSATTTCGGTASTTLPRTVTLTGGTIPAGSTTTPGTCTITVQVTAPVVTNAATYVNTIPPGSLVTDQGATNVLPATANVRVYPLGTGISANKFFEPDIITAGENSRLRVNLRAPEDTGLTNFTLIDNLPAGVTVSNSTAPFVSPNCGPTATLTAVTGSNTITLSNATINAGVVCRIDVWVTSSTPGTVMNVIPPGNITNDQNRTPPNDLTADLTVLALSDLAVNKAFTPGSVAPQGISTLTITLTNTNTSPLVDVSVVDNLPAGLTVAPAPNASTTCAGGTVTAGPGAQVIQLSGGSIPAQVGLVPGICTVNVNIQGSSTPGSYDNTIPAEDVSGTILSTGTTINPTQDANDILIVTDLILQIVKGFAPLTVFGGSASTMSIDLINPNDGALSGITFTDTMPSGMFLASPPNFSVGSCGGTLSGNPGDAAFTFSGGNLAAKALCTLTVSVTMNVNGNLTNAIPAGAATSLEGASNPDPTEATLTNLSGASVGKFFAPNPVAIGQYSLLTITIRNTGTIVLTGMGLIDNLPAGLAVASPPAPAPVNNCGGTLTAVSGSQVIQLTDGVLAGASDCTMVVAIVGASPGEYENIIPSGSLITDPAITNTQPAIDTLVVTDSSDGGGGGPGEPGGGGLIGLIPVTGFAPGRVTDLSGLPVTRYNALNDVTLEIPVLKLNLPIVGVPMKDRTWDVNWLLNKAGWLEGSAFPGYSGNSVLTSHVTLPYGQPGPFANLHKLKLGDKVFVHSYGELYIYEIKSFSERYATDPAILQHESKSWLTLVTCIDYDELAGTYRKRLVFKAALLQVQPDH